MSDLPDINTITDEIIRKELGVIYEMLICIEPSRKYEIFRTYAQSQDEALELMKKRFPTARLEWITLHKDMDSVHLSLVKSATSYAEGYQHLPSGYYRTHEMSEMTRQAINLLAEYYEGEDAVYIKPLGKESEEVYTTVNYLLSHAREGKKNTK